MLPAFEHDASGNLTQTTYPDDSFIRHQYDDRHLMITRVDERGNAYQHRYDDFGRLIDATLPDNTLRASISQTSRGLIDINKASSPTLLSNIQDSDTDYVDGRGNVSSQNLDPHGRPLIKVDELGRTTTYLFAMPIPTRPR